MPTFDGTDYLEAKSSDPSALGFMQGTPPPVAKRIRFEDDQFLNFPQIRCSLSHMRELVPTANVWRGAGGPGELSADNSMTAAAIPVSASRNKTSAAFSRRMASAACLVFRAKKMV